MYTVTRAILGPEEKAELARKHAGLVKHIASRLAVSLPAHIEMEDLLQDGVVGLMEALNRFDPNKGARFSTFAASRIRGAILDGLRSLDWASRGVRRRYREVQKAEETLSHTLGRAPSAGEVSLQVGVSAEEVHRRRQEANLTHVVSLDEPREPGDSPMDGLMDPSGRVEDAVLRNQKKQQLLRGLKTLKEREQQIMSLYYFEELNIREIGNIYGISEARVSQIHSRCLEKLREFLEPQARKSQRVG